MHIFSIINAFNGSLPFFSVVSLLSANNPTFYRCEYDSRANLHVSEMMQNEDS